MSKKESPPGIVSKRSGTRKQWELHFVMATWDGRGLLIQRECPQGTWGKMKVELGDDERTVELFARDVQDELSQHRTLIEKDLPCHTFDQVKGALGVYWHRLNAKQKAWLSGDGEVLLERDRQVLAGLAPEPDPKQQETERLAETALRVRQNSNFGAF